MSDRNEEHAAPAGPIEQQPEAPNAPAVAPTRGGPVTMEEARRLVQRAIDDERLLGKLDEMADAAKFRHDEAQANQVKQRRRVARAWAVALAALRCHARRLPMTPPAEHVQIDLAEHPTPAAPTVTLPEDAKSGDVYEDPATGMRYAVRAVPSGGLRAFAISPGE